MSQMLIPNTVTEACQMLSSGNRVACAGATNLYVDREKGKYLDRDIVSLHRLKELSGIREEKDGWHIGSLTTFDLIEDVFRGQGSMDALAEAASLVGGPQIRQQRNHWRQYFVSFSGGGYRAGSDGAGCSVGSCVRNWSAYGIHQRIYEGTGTNGYPSGGNFD